MSVKAVLTFSALIVTLNLGTLQMQSLPEVNLKLNAKATPDNTKVHYLSISS